MATWTVERDALAGKLTPRWSGCAETPTGQSERGGQQVSTWSLRCTGRADVRFEGPGLATVDVFARVVRRDGTVRTVVLDARRPRLFVPDAHTDHSFVPLGVEHILLGPDHLLFVFGFVLLVGFRRRLVWAITGFTVGHSLTLAGAALGVVSLPGPPVEAVIAASILLLAVELAKPREESWARRWPWAVAGGFGLLHGFGFAGALGELGLPATGRLSALLQFNVGVELGQLAFVAVAWVVWRLAPPVERLRPVAVYGLGTVAAFWLIERVATFPG